MCDSTLLGVWVRRFLLEHLVGERNLAHNTQQSYRDTLALLLPFVAAHHHKTVDHLTVTDLSDQVLRLFLAFIEEERHCLIRTRNQRLASVHAFARFIAERSPEHVGWCSQIRMVPFKRFDKPGLTYLDKPEMDAILAAPDRHTPQGRRDYALLLFLYNSGARASEAASLKIGDVDLHSNGNSSIRLAGKGKKARFCPLWTVTSRELLALIRDRGPGEPVFLNCRQQPITRFGIYTLLKRSVKRASATQPTLLHKSVGPHTIRHTTATHLLRSGVDINTIRAWLGHVSIDTTNIYAEVDLEMKAQMLARCSSFRTTAPPKRRWRDNQSLMAFLRSL